MAAHPPGGPSWAEILGGSAPDGSGEPGDAEDSTGNPRTERNNQNCGSVPAGSRIDVEDGHIESDVADMAFSGYQLKTATIVGSPATFEMQRPGSDQVTYAEAGRLVYNFDEGIIEFSEQATITEGGNQISSNFLVYNIAEQRINASGGGDCLCAHSKTGRKSVPPPPPKRSGRFGLPQQKLSRMASWSGLAPTATATVSAARVTPHSGAAARWPPCLPWSDCGRCACPP